MSESIDAVDYAILKCLDENGGSWKKQVHNWVTEHRNELPAMPERSVQTIGRRIDSLHDDEEIESCILSQDSTTQGMTIGYQLTDKGRETLEAKQDAILRKSVVAAAETLLTDSNSSPDISREALIAVMADNFDIDDRTRTKLLPKLGTGEIIALLGAHYFLSNLGNTLNPENKDVIAAVLKNTPEFAAPFTKKNMIARVREALTGDADHARPEKQAVSQG